MNILPDDVLAARWRWADLRYPVLMKWLSRRFMRHHAWGYAVRRGWDVKLTDARPERVKVAGLGS